METLETKMINKETGIFKCNCCDYVTSYKTNYNRHLKSNKHKKYTTETKMITNDVVNQCTICSKIFKTRGGLWKHSKKCTVENKSNSLKDEVILKVLEENSDLRKLLGNQQKQIDEMIPKLGNNNNNQFNLNVFLNEKCKDAVHWEEFIKSIEVGIEQLNVVMNGSITKGIVQIICQNIDDLGLYKRPIHCVDTKRKKICIKRESGWEHNQDKNNEILKSSERKLQQKHVLLIQEWQKQHPNWCESETETALYIDMVQKLMESVDEIKCINEISKNVVIPKTTIDE